MTLKLFLALHLLLSLTSRTGLHAQSTQVPSDNPVSVAAKLEIPSPILNSPIPEGDVAVQYRLGPEDVIKIWALGAEEFSDKPFRIDPSGFVDLPLVGRIEARGLTMLQLREQIMNALASEVIEPRVSVEIVEFGSQPVSLVGAVATPGVHQLRGQKTLAEVLALAGGLKPDAGSTINIVRRLTWGPIPLPGIRTDPSGNFTVAEIKLQDFIAASNPAQNILIRPNEVISVPRAEMVYVIGAVRKPGAFTLNEHESMSVLQALSMAEGLGPSPAPGNAKILRAVPGQERQELEVDVAKVVSGKAEDIGLRPNDVLFIPTSTSKQVAKRTLEAALQTITGTTIWRR